MQLPPPAAYTDWSDEIAEDAVGEMNGAICIYDPPSTTPVIGPVNVGDVGRRARIQNMRIPRPTTNADEWEVNRAIRFQIEILAGDPPLRKGMVVRVTDGGKDPSLVNFAFIIETAVNSSHAALRTIETISELAVVPPVS